jgi:hypothetical protein
MKFGFRHSQVSAGTAMTLLAAVEMAGVRRWTLLVDSALVFCDNLKLGFAP